MGNFEFGVTMSCASCSNAVNRVLNRIDGVKNVDISLDSQKVLIEAEPTVSYQTLHDQIAKTGKPITYGKEI